MVAQSIIIGIIVGFLFYELTGFSPGGIVVAGYLALVINTPSKIISTIAAGILTYLLVEAISNYTILYGRRRFMSMIMVGLAVKWLLEELFIRIRVHDIELIPVGYVIPGLIANDMKRQGVIPTILSIIIVMAIVSLILRLLL
ncbi:poly-gamma-glutamate biosynthesis protein PgsC [Candidatus Aerophobetes bacterium]|uniref:Poly-gamma-glutamate biosynthesis protein PgsC n=1 Tax=Aerophobetes bacterium TaxID=2030807 RepID=A0A662DL74_UNCAE|nr:MAG: poly-gamma-glutamate biosynthesis protein PgsC [Candidatus Aerophobetes bacterium]